MREFIRGFAKDESGVTALEYGLIAALISLALVTGAGIAGTAVGQIFTFIGTTLTTAAANAGA
jgi:pilus assembly protein Flp/PilA